jgi:hypothetical protein
MPNMVPGMPSMPGTDLLSTLGVMGTLSLLNSLPQLITNLPQQLWGAVTGMASMLTQLPQALMNLPQTIGQAFGSLFTLGQSLLQSSGNLLGINSNTSATQGQLASAQTPPATAPVSAVQGGVASSQPYSPSGPTSPSTPLNPDGDLTVAQKNSKWGQNGYIDTTNLVKVEGVYLQPEIADKYYAMKAAAKEAGYDIYLTDGYRSYAGQVRTKANWTARGKAWAAATPGTSNHGWGAAIDIGDNNGGAGQIWCQENMTKFGLRNYRGGTTAIRGTEQWHFQLPGL